MSHKWTQTATFIAVLAVLGIIGAAFNPHPATAQNAGANAQGTAPVTIVSPLPLPVTGSLSVGGTVAATQSGTWNVGISGTPKVEVSRNDEDPARAPFQTRLCMAKNSDNCTDNLNFPTSFVVPAGKRLVIEQISGECFPSGAVLAVGITVTTGGATVSHLFGVQYPIAGTTGYTNHLTRLYADGGTSVVPVNNSLVPNLVACDVALSGYLITP